MKLSPLEERARQLYNNPSALLWTDWNLAQEVDAEFDRLADILGTRWTRAQVDEIFGVKAGKEPMRDTVSVPLSFIIQPEFQDALKNMFGSKFGIDAPDWVRKVEIVEGWDIPREQFINLAHGASVALPVAQMRQQQQRK